MNVLTSVLKQNRKRIVELIPSATENAKQGIIRNMERTERKQRISKLILYMMRVDVYEEMLNILEKINSGENLEPLREKCCQLWTALQNKGDDIHRAMTNILRNREYRKIVPLPRHWGCVCERQFQPTTEDISAYLEIVAQKTEQRIETLEKIMEVTRFQAPRVTGKREVVLPESTPRVAPKLVSTLESPNSNVVSRIETYIKRMSRSFGNVERQIPILANLGVCRGTEKHQLDLLMTLLIRRQGIEEMFTAVDRIKQYFQYSALRWDQIREDVIRFYYLFRNNDKYRELAGDMCKDFPSLKDEREEMCGLISNYWIMTDNPKMADFTAKDIFEYHGLIDKLLDCGVPRHKISELYGISLEEPKEHWPPKNHVSWVKPYV